MAELNKETVSYLAGLSRIAVTEEEEDGLLADLAKILSYIDQLNEIDTTNVKPCTYVTQSLSQTPLRADRAEPSLTRDAFLKNTPSQIGGMVRVPPVLKQE